MKYAIDQATDKKNEEMFAKRGMTGEGLFVINEKKKSTNKSRGTSKSSSIASASFESHSSFTETSDVQFGSFRMPKGEMLGGASIGDATSQGTKLVSKKRSNSNLCLRDPVQEQQRANFKKRSHENLIMTTRGDP